MYDIQNKKGKGYIGSVVIAKLNPKTQERMRFTFCDEANISPTELEAKHVIKYI